VSLVTGYHFFVIVISKNLRQFFSDVYPAVGRHVKLGDHVIVIVESEFRPLQEANGLDVALCVATFVVIDILVSRAFGTHAPNWPTVSLETSRFSPSKKNILETFQLTNLLRIEGGFRVFGGLGRATANPDDQYQGQNVRQLHLAFSAIVRLDGIYFKRCLGKKKSCKLNSCFNRRLGITKADL